MNAVRVLTGLAISAVIGGIPPANAGTTVQVPAGTTVPLKFLAPLDSSAVQEGTTVTFEVAADVLVNRLPIFLRGAHAQGTVTDVSPPGLFGGNVVVHIGFVRAMAVDRRLVYLSPLDVTNSVRLVKDIEGSRHGKGRQRQSFWTRLGLRQVRWFHGGHFSVPAGAVGTVKVTHTISIYVPSHLFGDYHVEPAAVLQR